MKKSSTVWDFQNLSGLDKTNSKSRLKKDWKQSLQYNFNAFDFDADYPQLKTQEAVFSSTSNLLSQFWNEMIDHGALSKENYLLKSTCELPPRIMKSQQNLRKIKSRVEQKSGKTNKVLNKQYSGLKRGKSKRFKIMKI